LLGRGWLPKQRNDRFERFEAPALSAIPPEMTLILPAATEAPDLSPVLARLLITVSDLYGVAPEQLAPVLTNTDTVLSLQVDDEYTKDGTIGLSRFEGLVESLQSMLLDAAAFAVSEDPLIEEIPRQAHLFLENCRFLQTARGSFVANVQLPAAAKVSSVLFPEDAPTAEAVSQRLLDTLGLVVGPVFASHSEVFSDRFVAEHLDLLNVNVLTDIRDLFNRAGDSSLSFSFMAVDSTNAVATGALTPGKRAAVAEYVKFVTDRVASTTEIDTKGHIVELRSRDPKSYRNYILVQAPVENELVYVGLRLSKQLYQVAIQAHRDNRAVRIRGRAKRLKTQYKVVELVDLEAER